MSKLLDAINNLEVWSKYWEPDHPPELIADMQTLICAAKTSAITPEWLQSRGFSRVPCHVHGTPETNWWHDELQLEIGQFNDGPWLWLDADHVEMRTRAAIEALMHWVRVSKNN